MTYLQTILDRIEAEARSQSLAAMAGADTIETAMTLAARINAAAEHDICIATILTLVRCPLTATLHAARGAQIEFLVALETIGGYNLARCPQQPALPLGDGIERVRITLSPTIEALTTIGALSDYLLAALARDDGIAEAA